MIKGSINEFGISFIEKKKKKYALVEKKIYFTGTYLKFNEIIHLCSMYIILNLSLSYVSFPKVCEILVNVEFKQENQGVSVE